MFWIWRTLFASNAEPLAHLFEVLPGTAVEAKASRLKCHDLSIIEICRTISRRVRCTILLSSLS